MKRYEICVHDAAIDEDGSIDHIDNVDEPFEVGVCVYVREYATEDPEEETWDEVYDETFADAKDADVAVQELQVKYPNATIDRY